MELDVDITGILWSYGAVELFSVCSTWHKKNSETFQLVFKGSGLVYRLQLSTKTQSNSKYFFLIRGLLALWWRNKIQLHNTLPTRKANNVYLCKANNNRLASLKAFSFFFDSFLFPEANQLVVHRGWDCGGGGGGPAASGEL